MSTSERMKDYSVKIGDRFGRLTVTASAQPVNHCLRFQCNCDCGKVMVRTASSLASKGEKSCGCIAIERIAKLRLAHGLTKTKTHKVWCGMRKRCRDLKNIYYAAKGITICDRWDRFENFLEDMGECPHGHTIERNDNKIGYEPSNCVWATMKKQSNNKSNSIVHERDGVRKTIAEWAQCLDVPVKRVYARLKLGWDAETALTEPKHEGRGVAPNQKAAV